MKNGKPTVYLIAGACMSVAAVLQAVGLARYVGRLPDDWVGIGLYIAALVGFAIAALGFFIQWNREKRRQQRTEAARDDK